MVDNAGVVLHSEAPSGHPRQPLAVESGEVGAEKALADAVPGQVALLGQAPAAAWHPVPQLPTHQRLPLSGPCSPGSLASFP